MRKTLVAVHGYEPPNWARELPGVLPLSPGAVVRVLWRSSTSRHRLSPP